MRLSVLILGLFLPLVLKAQVHKVSFKGDLLNSESQSASVFFGSDFLILGGDEENYIQVLEKESSSQYKIISNIPLLDEKTIHKGEIDVEGLASLGNKVYGIGSHSLVRKSISANKTYEENLKALKLIKEDDFRKTVFRVSLNLLSGKKESEVETQSLWPIFEKDSILKRFINIPSKENGTDIEALAVDENGYLWVGFRGPLIRGNFVPVLVIHEDELFSNKSDKTYELRLVNFGGLGIRGLARVSNGFLVLAGPTASLGIKHRVYFWNGKNSLPDKGNSHPFKIKDLGKVPYPKNKGYGRPESIAVLREGSTHYEALITFDGLEKGAPQLIKIKK